MIIGMLVFAIGSAGYAAAARMLSTGFGAAMLTAAAIMAFAVVVVAVWMPNVTADQWGRALSLPKGHYLVEAMSRCPAEPSPAGAHSAPPERRSNEWQWHDPQWVSFDHPIAAEPKKYEPDGDEDSDCPAGRHQSGR
jgi:hypothetical protein